MVRVCEWKASCDLVRRVVFVFFSAAAAAAGMFDFLISFNG